MKIYGDSISGNCHKVKFIADYLALPYTWQETNILEGESRTPEYLDKNPQGQTPMIELSDGRILAQSNAIIRYLARESELVPTDPWAAAKVDEWLFWEQYSHEPYVAVCRFQVVYQDRAIADRDPWRVERGEAALDLMEDHLRDNAYLTSAFSIADIALLAYTRLCHEGGFSLDARPAISRWVSACEIRLGITHSTD
ncbi:MAG: glutathione S-transferase family protein [Pseudomonadota bacterium]